MFSLACTKCLIIPVTLLSPHFPLQLVPNGINQNGSEWFNQIKYLKLLWFEAYNQYLMSRKRSINISSESLVSGLTCFDYDIYWWIEKELRNIYLLVLRCKWKLAYLTETSLKMVWIKNERWAMRDTQSFSSCYSVSKFHIFPLWVFKGKRKLYFPFRATMIYYILRHRNRNKFWIWIQCTLQLPFEDEARIYLMCV